MEENEFKNTYADYNSNPCAFYKAVLRRCAGCSRAQKVFACSFVAGLDAQHGSELGVGPRSHTERLVVKAQ